MTIGEIELLGSKQAHIRSSIPTILIKIPHSSIN